MADSSKILLTGEEKPVYQLGPLKKELAELTTQLLRDNHKEFHVFFNDRGFHNHIPHQLLTLYALSAPPFVLTAAYKDNSTYQKPLKPAHAETTTALSQPQSQSASSPSAATTSSFPYTKHLGDSDYYQDYVVFFAAQAAAKGWPTVVREALFADTPQATDLLARLYAGVVHPLLHLGFGVEFALEGVVVEGLAQAAVHEDWTARVFRDCDAAAAAKRGVQAGGAGRRKGFLELVRAVSADEKVREAARAVGQYSDGREMWDSVGERLADVAGEFVVLPTDEDVERRAAEVVNASVLLATTALQPHHIPKLDFFHMHLITSSISLLSILHSPDLSLPASTRARILTLFARTALFVYATRGAQPLSPARLYTYDPKRPDDDEAALVARTVALPMEDGHAVKALRGVLAAWQFCSASQQQEDEHEESFEWGITDDATWRKAAHLVVDAVEAPGPKWVRAAAWVELWAEVPLVEDEGKSLGA
ncbi:uncharacterized protein J3D65DRAFT_545172 [Phyllosticta citribraziliensis]|uniref:Oxidoreductase AflY n=1 Tax=Phyllosticta citribraziliensis TaxID=989973 RepID=A0ABR1ME03_9PEZI